MIDQLLNPKLIGAIIGLIIGIVAISVGAWKAFILVLFVLAGWLLVKFWTGEIDFLDAYERFLSSRGKRPRR